MKKLTSGMRAEFDACAENRKKRILSSSTDVVVSGRKYYVSPDGDDNNCGESPECPWKSLNKVNNTHFEVGDAVFFERGKMWRGVIDAQSGVTYSAYGEGNKPELRSSPFDGAEHGFWTLTDAKDVYVYSEKIQNDVGMLVFDSGKAHGLKATVNYSSGINKTNGEKFSSYCDLKEDLSFWHDLGGANLIGNGENGLLYLKSENGNPAERFSSIEFNIRTNAIRIRGDNVRINNLCVKYCGCHGVGSGTVSGLHVDYCVFEWIGGSVQYYSNGNPVRFGNAVEIYGGCNDYCVENCYINEAYDAGLTHQFSSGGEEEIIMRNVTYKGNLIENCIYSIEYFLGKPSDAAYRHMSNVRISDNIMRRCGYGFGKQRPDKGPDVHIKSWDHFNDAEDMIFENNVFDTGAHMLLHISAEREEWLPIIRNNVFIQAEGAGFARIGAYPTTPSAYNDEETGKYAQNNTFYAE